MPPSRSLGAAAVLAIEGDNGYGHGMAVNAPRRVAVLCAALNVEYQALREHLPAVLEEHDERGTLYEIAELPGWRVVLTLTGRDNTTAAAQTERAIAAFAPQVVIFAGIAGGRRDSRHADVIVATEIYDYESGMDTNTKYRPRIKTARSSHALIQQAQALARSGHWRQRIVPQPPPQDPRVFVRPLAAGGKVVAGNESATAAFIADHCSDAQGIDMEGYGVLHSAYANADVAAIVIRGVSDLLGDKSKTTDKHWQPVAARHAAAFAFGLLARLDIQRFPVDTPPNHAPAGDSYIGVQGDHSTVNIAAVGPHSQGTINIDNGTTGDR